MTPERKISPIGRINVAELNEGELVKIFHDALDADPENSSPRLYHISPTQADPEGNNYFTIDLLPKNRHGNFSQRYKVCEINDPEAHYIKIERYTDDINEKMIKVSTYEELSPVTHFQWDGTIYMSVDNKRRNSIQVFKISSPGYIEWSETTDLAA